MDAASTDQPEPYTVASSGAQLWAEYAADPDRHPLIPNCSHAGYGRGERPVPDVEAVVDAADFGAVGDGRADNTAGSRRRSSGVARDRHQPHVERR